MKTASPTDGLFKHKGKHIDTPSLTVKDNILSFKDYFLLISNISQVSVEYPQKRSYKNALIMLILGIVVLIALNFGAALTVIGIVLILAGILLIAVIYNYNSTLGQYLAIMLNSGSLFYFNSRNQAFLYEVMETLKYCANNPNSSYTMDFKNSVVTIGSHNEIKADINKDEGEAVSG